MFTVDSLQNKFIDNLITKQLPVSVFLKNGIRLRGHLISHTEKYVFLRQGTTQMIFKAKINTINQETQFKTYNLEKN